ncbi:MAG: GYDIA family GHMP kinase [Bacteroidia bacterium]|nr:GYDIA family GHMP kinase [Bacteroidia bacterium]
MNKFFSHGKLLITGEYVVLDQALSLAIPTLLGQHMHVKELDKLDARVVLWRSISVDGNCWYEGKFTIQKDPLSGINTLTFDSNSQNHDIGNMLLHILNKAIELNPNFLSDKSYYIETQLDFDRSWGLGSSSTLICNIAKWAEVDAFELSKVSFGGSGYDIAVGMLGGDVLYRSPSMWEGYVFNPPFKEQLFFVHLNKKQDSREGINTYRKKEVSKKIVDSISSITEKMISCKDFNEFQKLIEEHERIIANVIEKNPIKLNLFSDYPYAIKSLGAWGGDFILVCGDNGTPEYFKSKGYNTVITYKDLII